MGQKDIPMVVLKADDLHCDGCAEKITKCIRSFYGVKGVIIQGDKIMVVGDVDPAKLRERVLRKTRRTVELISPLPKDNNNEDETVISPLPDETKIPSPSPAYPPIFSDDQMFYDNPIGCSVM